ncbi:hypothetical protein [Lactobacillus taiwanensis]|uniref:hypothetical protein n=1 Tax=Lactobacillus taiwanensis TaxID=508451 RepID=UPI00241F2C20|nr:hypothetical protein [Lactobacillus taiwanensis]
MSRSTIEKSIKEFEAYFEGRPNEVEVATRIISNKEANFWNNAPRLITQEREEEIKDLGYNPLE